MLVGNDDRRAQPDSVRRTVTPLVLGLAAMLSALVGPGWISGLVALLGAFVAGMLNREEPVRAGLLTVAPPVVGGLARVLVDKPSALGALVFAATGAAAFAMVASHVGAGLQRRRKSTATDL